MLPAIVAIIEALGAEGGAAALAGGAGEGAGVLGSIGRLMGGVKSFGSQQELGQALRQISDLSNSVAQAKAAMEHNRQQQESIAAKARDDEQKYAFSDPGHTQQLAELARRNQEHQSAAMAAQRQLAALQARATVTTDPAAARAASMAQAGRILGVGAAITAATPTIIRNSPPVIIGSNLAQAGANVAGNFTTPVAGGIISQAVQQAGNIAGQINPLAMAGSVLTRGPLGPLEQLSKASIEIAKLPGNIINWSNALIESQRAISRYSPILSRMIAENERRGIVRGIESAERTGGATSDLSDSMNNLLDILQPMKDTVTVGLARGLTVGIQIVTEGVKYLHSIWEVVRRLPVGKEVDELLREMERGSKLDAALRMMPLQHALNDLVKRDRSKPRDIPRR